MWLTSADSKQPFCWTCQQFLEDIQEDERLGELMAAVQKDEKLAGEAAQKAYLAYLSGEN